MTISKTIQSSFRHAYEYINDLSKSLPIDRRIQAYTAIAFSIVTPLVYYRKEIHNKFFDHSPTLSSFLKNTKYFDFFRSSQSENIEEQNFDLIIEEENDHQIEEREGERTQENRSEKPKQQVDLFLQSLHAEVVEENEIKFNPDEKRSPEEWTRLLTTTSLTADQILCAAERVHPSAEPSPSSIQTDREVKVTFIGNLASECYRVVKGIDNSLSWTGAIKTIGNSPKAYATALLNFITILAYDKVISPLFEQMQENEVLKFSKVTVLAGTTAAFFFAYRLMHQELPHGVVNLSELLKYRKIPFRGLSFYPSWKSSSSYKDICDEILTSFFSKNLSQKKAVILYTQDHNSFGAPIEELVEELAVIAYTGRSKYSFQVWDVDIKTFLAYTNEASDFVEFWSLTVRLAQSRGNVILHLSNFDELTSEKMKEENSESSESAATAWMLKRCRNIIYESLKKDKVHCIISSLGKEPMQLINGSRKECFHPIVVYRMEPLDTKEYLKRNYSAKDRWNRPRVGKEAIETVLQMVENYQLNNSLPIIASSTLDQAVYLVSKEQTRVKRQHPIESKQRKKVGAEVGSRLDEARRLKEKLFENFSDLRRTLKGKQSPALIQIAKELLFVEHVLIPLIYKELKQQLKQNIEDQTLSWDVTKLDLIHLMQRNYKALLYGATPTERKRWKELPAFLLQKYPKRENEINTVCETLEKRRIDFQANRKPNSLIIYGPPGTGKSSLASLVAGKIFEIYDVEEDTNKVLEENVLRRHLSQIDWDRGFDKFYDEIYKQVDKCNTSVLIFEEIDKAPANALGMIFEILESPYMKNRSGYEGQVPLGSVTILFTTNLCSNELSEPMEDQIEDQFEKDQEILLEVWKNNIEESNYAKDIQVKMQTTVKAFLERFDAKIPFRALDKGSIAQYIENILNEKIEGYKQQNFVITFDKSVNEMFKQNFTGCSWRPLIAAIEDRLYECLKSRIDEFQNATVSIKFMDDQLIAEKTGDWKKSSSKNKVLEFDL